MAIDLSSFITFAPIFLRNAAFLINLGLLIYYGWLAIFLGKYISGVFREHIGLPARIGATLVFGFLAIITGSSVEKVSTCTSAASTRCSSNCPSVNKSFPEKTSNILF